MASCGTSGVGVVIVADLAEAVLTSYYWRRNWSCCSTTTATMSAAAADAEAYVPMTSYCCSTMSADAAADASDAADVTMTVANAAAYVAAAAADVPMMNYCCCSTTTNYHCSAADAVLTSYYCSTTASYHYWNYYLTAKSVAMAHWMRRMMNYYWRRNWNCCSTKSVDAVPYALDAADVTMTVANAAAYVAAAVADLTDAADVTMTSCYWRKNCYLTKKSVVAADAMTMANYHCSAVAVAHWMRGMTSYCYLTKKSGGRGYVPSRKV